MLWHAMPPELNTARLMAGAGPAPMLQAAAGWEALGSALETQATELATNLVSLKASWTGISSERAVAGGRGALRVTDVRQSQGVRGAPDNG